MSVFPGGIRGADETRTAPAIESWDERALQLELASSTILDFDSWRITDAAPRVVTIRIPKPTVKVAGFTFPESPWATAWMKPATPTTPPSGTSAGRPASTERATGRGARSKADAHQAAGRHHQARRSTVLRPAAAARNARRRAATSTCRSSRSRISSKASASSIRATRPMLADEMGLGKTMQAITTIRLLLRSGEIAQRVAGLPQAAGVATGGASSTCGRPKFRSASSKGTRPDGTGNGGNQRPRQDRQLRTAHARSRRARRRPAFRPRRARRSPADQEHAPARPAKSCARSRASRSWALTGTPIENSPDDLVGIFEFLSPGYLRAGMQPRRMGERWSRTTSCAAPRTWCSPTCRRNCSATPNSTSRPSSTRRIDTAEDEGVMRLTEMGAGDHDPARLRTRAAAEADLQLRSRRPARAANSNVWKPTWKKSPPAARRRSSSANGSSPSRDSASDWRVSARSNTTAKCRPSSARRVIEQFKNDPVETRDPDELRRGQRRP